MLRTVHLESRVVRKESNYCCVHECLGGTGKLQDKGYRFFGLLSSCAHLKGEIQ